MDPNLSGTERHLSNGDKDIFIAQYGFVNTCKATTGTLTADVCGPYEAPSGGKFYHKSGIYVDTLVNAEGCDSLITITLTIRNTFSTIHQTVCESFKAPSGKELYTSGTYIDTIPNNASCDSIITINLIVAKNYSKILRTACDTFYSPSGKYKYSSSGTYYDTLSNQLGCDSIIEIDLSIKKSTFSTITTSTCDSLVSPSGKYIYKSTSVYSDTLVNSHGCDSIISINLTVNKPSSHTMSISACDSMRSPSGTYTDTLLNWKGCDSLITIIASINQSKRIKINPTVCDSFVSPSAKYTFSQSGVYFDTLQTKKGCDSIIEIDLTVYKPSSAIANLTSCDSLLSPSGKYTYLQSGNYSDTLQNWRGCDSVITLNVTINKTQQTSVSIKSCDSLISPSGKYLYQKSGNYTDTLTAKSGCDSILNISFNRLLATQSSISVETCKQFTSPSAKYIYSQTGVYSDTLINAAGCDSIITINLKILEPIESNISVTACDEYISPSGKYSYSSSGIYQDTLSSYKGCDSVISIELKIIDNQPKISFNNNALQVDIADAKYQWLDCDNDYAIIDTATRQKLMPTKSGEYTVVVYEGSCADTADCYDVVILDLMEADIHKISIYPNPAEDLLFISSEEPVQSLKVYHLEGKLLMQNYKETQISIEDLAPSIYYIEVETEKGIVRFKFVKS